MSADRFLDRLENQGLVDAAVLRNLRKQVASSRVVVTPEAVGKLLVDGGHLTPKQVKKIIADLGVTDSPESRPRPMKSAEPSDDLGFAPLGDGTDAVKSTESKATDSKSSAGPSKSGGQPSGESRQSDGGKSKFKMARAAAPPAVRKAAGSEGLQPLDAGGLQPLDGGLSSLDGELAPLGGPGDFGAMAGQTPSAAKPVEPQDRDSFAGFRKKRSQTFSTSMLILFGVPGLCLLFFLSWVLLSQFIKGNAREQFTRAETAFKDQSYAQAIKEYDLYVKNNPSGDDLSQAKVRRAIAKIRLATDGAKDFRSALETAQNSLKEVEKEVKFAMAREDLRALLPKIAGGFADQAKNSPDRKRAQEHVDLADKAMELVNNPSYIPTKDREDAQMISVLGKINRSIDLAKRTIQKEIALEKALAVIQSHVSDGNTVGAFAIRAELLKAFPELESDKSLSQAVNQISDRERSLVKSLTEARNSASTDVAGAARALRIFPSRRIGQPVSGVENQIVFVLARGTVFGIDAATGQVLWRRHVGAETLIQPQPLSKLPGADAIVSDSRRQEILRVKARTGEVLWRFPMQEPFASPAVVEDRILVSAFSGKIYQLDLESGNSTLGCQLPQSITVGIGGNPRVEQVYQIGNHSNIYVLNPASLACTEVFYLGHRDGSIAVPPVLALQHLFVVTNTGSDYCELHIMRANEKGGQLRRIGEPLRMAGNVVVPLVHTKNRVTVLTNYGELRVMSVDPSNEETPVRTDAAMIASSNSPIPGYHIVDGASVLVGGDRFSAFDIQTAREQLNRRWSLHESETFVAPLIKVGNTVIHTRRRRGSAGVTVSAALIETGAVVWRTDIAVPAPILAYDASRSQVVGVSSLGDVYRTGLKASAIDKPNEVVEVDGAEVAFSFGDPAYLADGRIAMTNQRDRAQVLLFSSQLESGSARTIRMDIGDAKVSVPAAALGNVLVMPLDSGQVVAFQPDTGKPAALPFQPQLEPGTKIPWRDPATTGNEIVLTDGAKRLYRIGLKDQPQSHLEQLAAGAPPADLVGGIAIAGDTVYGVTRGASGDLVQAFHLADLTIGQEFPLTGRVAQGPWQVGDLVLLVSSKEGLVCFERGQSRRWQVPLNYGPLSGPPRLDRGELLLSSQTGIVWRVARADGMELDKLEIGDPLIGSATSMSAGVLVNSIDGSWIAVPWAKGGSSAVGAGR